jgi:hypothetical protein
MPSRRDAVRLGGVVTLSGLAGCLGDEYDAPAPPDGEWWSARRGPRNCAAAPGATPPRTDPTTAWRRTFDASDPPVGVLVAHGVVYAVRPTGTTALSPETGDLRFETDGDGQTPAAGLPRVAAADDETLYTADGTALRAYDDAGTHLWTTRGRGADDAGGTRTYGLLATSGGVLRGTHGRLSAFDAAGAHRWTYDPPGSDATYPAVAGGTLYVATPGPLVAASRPSLVDVAVGDAPSVRWRADAPGRPTWPAVTGDRVLVGERSLVGENREAVVRAVRRGGTDGWTARVPGPTSHLAVSEAAGLAYLVASESLLALDLATGDRVWSRTDAGLRAEAGGTVAVAGDSLVVAGFSDRSSDPVRALDAASGKTRWRTPVRGRVTAVAPAGPSLYVATALGDVVALR